VDVNFLYGILDLTFWQYVLVTVVLVQITIAAVTVYLHRDAAHRSVDLHPAVRHFFRFWVWLTTGQVTSEWVAVHRKHHAKCETPDDPHSPVVYGLKKVLFEGTELYRAEARRPETVEKYGRGCPNDWIERNLYASHRNLGITMMVLTDLILFGAPGIIMIAVQMSAIPFLAAGVINGLGHHTGYRNFECPDAATNIVPWGLLIGGEELHNNHHAFPSSAKFSIRSWEFDMGWLWIRLFSMVGLAKVLRVAPTPVTVPARRQVDLETVRAVIVNRMHVLRAYTTTVMVPTFKAEVRAAGGTLSRRARRLLVRQPLLLDDASRARLREVLASNQALQTVHEYRERLQVLWSGSNMSNERLLAHLREWIAQAEASRVKALQEFAQQLRGYAMSPAAR
jgi:stearoyl-CoA desaturase (delta-9 desaturase)